MFDSFETEFSAADLLSGFAGGNWVAQLEKLTRAPVSLMDCAGNVLLSSRDADEPAATRAPVKIDFEPIAWLHSPCAADVLEAAAGMLSLVFQSRARYLMAAALHSEVSIADFQALQQRNRDLEESEARYRALAEQLEQRVREQVATIETAQRNLYENERLSSVGRLAAGVAHEINNPMAFVCSNLQSTRRSLNKIQAFRDNLLASDSVALNAWRDKTLDKVMANLLAMQEESEEGCRRITAIVRNLKGFSNVDNDEWLEVNVNDLLEQVCSVATCGWPADIVLERRLLTPVNLHCRPAHLSQAIHALLSNSRHALSDVQGAKNIILASTVEQGQLCIQVRDSGAGICSEHLARVFDPFFTTRPVGAGVGLGLTICRDVVLAHGGRIWIESRAGEGTSVNVTLPLQAAGVR